MPVSQPRGVRDFGPSQAIARKRIVAVIEETFKRFGFSPLETPAIENMEVLNAKAYGEDASKQIYQIQDDDSALRFDLTIPMARYVASNGSIPLPFKRYQIGQTWRRDEPQKMRYREFTQADVDIVGAAGIESDAEVMAATALALEELGFTDYKILLNNRIVLDKILSTFGVGAEKQPAAIRAIDKISKIGRQETIKQLTDVVKEDRSSEKIIGFLVEAGTNAEKLERIAAEVGAKDEAESMRALLELVRSYNIQGELVFDPSLARGLDYYTSYVWEFVVFGNGKQLPTIAGGGRYDNLIGLYGKKSLPAVGSSLGIDRIFDVIEQKVESGTYSDVFVAVIGDENYGYALSIANALRAKGVYTDINATKRNISKQLEYANALKFKYAAIIGAQEKNAKKLKLRDLVSGDEVLLAVDEAIEKIRG